MLRPKKRYTSAASGGSGSSNSGHFYWVYILIILSAAAIGGLIYSIYAVAVVPRNQLVPALQGPTPTGSVNTFEITNCGAAGTAAAEGSICGTAQTGLTLICNNTGAIYECGTTTEGRWTLIGQLEPSSVGKLLVDKCPTTLSCTQNIAGWTLLCNPAGMYFTCNPPVWHEPDTAGPAIVGIMQPPAIVNISRSTQLAGTREVIYLKRTTAAGGGGGGTAESGGGKYYATSGAEGAALPVSFQNEDVIHYEYYNGPMLIGYASARYEETCLMDDETKVPICWNGVDYCTFPIGVAGVSNTFNTLSEITTWMTSSGYSLNSYTGCWYRVAPLGPHAPQEPQGPAVRYYATIKKK